MEQSVFQNNSVFFIEVEKVRPNPFQPRREFDQGKLQELADSIRMYGILQPLTVTRKEVVKEDGGLTTEYELIAGERRLRASKLAGLREVPALIRSAEDDDRTKLELAIIENLQREDLNAIDRAIAFNQLAEKFKFTHAQIGKKVGRSREYVSNSIRILMLPPEIQEALREGKISEGHTRPILMLGDRPEEQNVLFREIMLKKMTVRDAEKISRKIAYDKVRKVENMRTPEIAALEEEVSSTLGTRVHIAQKEVGGKIEIDFLDEANLRKIVEILNQTKSHPEKNESVEEYFAAKTGESADANSDAAQKNQRDSETLDSFDSNFAEPVTTVDPNLSHIPEEQPEEVVDDEDADLYSVKDFNI